jgi:hypothetical protein
MSNITGISKITEISRTWIKGFQEGFEDIRTQANRLHWSGPSFVPFHMQSQPSFTETTFLTDLTIPFPDPALEHNVKGNQ